MLKKAFIIPVISVFTLISIYRQYMYGANYLLPALFLIFVNVVSYYVIYLKLKIKDTIRYINILLCNLIILVPIYLYFSKVDEFIVIIPSDYNKEIELVFDQKSNQQIKIYNKKYYVFLAKGDSVCNLPFNYGNRKFIGFASNNTLGEKLCFRKYDKIEGTNNDTYKYFVELKCNKTFNPAR